MKVMNAQEPLLCNLLLYVEDLKSSVNGMSHGRRTICLPLPAPTSPLLPEVFLLLLARRGGYLVSKAGGLEAALLGSISSSTPDLPEGSSIQASGDCTSH